MTWSARWNAAICSAWMRAASISLLLVASAESPLPARAVLVAATTSSATDVLPCPTVPGAPPAPPADDATPAETHDSVVAIHAIMNAYRMTGGPCTRRTGADACARRTAGCHPMHGIGTFHP